MSHQTSCGSTETESCWFFFFEITNSIFLNCYKIKKINHLWLHWVFVAAQASSSLGDRGLLSNCGAQTSHCGGCSCCGAQALGLWASVVSRGL